MTQPPVLVNLRAWLYLFSCFLGRNPNSQIPENQFLSFVGWEVEDKVSLYGLGCPGTSSINQVGLKLRDLPVPGS